MTKLIKYLNSSENATFLYAPEKDILIAVPPKYPHRSILDLYNQRERAEKKDPIEITETDCIYGYIGKEAGTETDCYFIWNHGSPKVEGGTIVFKGHVLDDKSLADTLKALVDNYGDRLVRVWLRSLDGQTADDCLKFGKASKVIEKISSGKSCLESKL